MNKWEQYWADLGKEKRRTADAYINQPAPEITHANIVDEAMATGVAQTDGKAVWIPLPAKRK